MTTDPDGKVPVWVRFELDLRAAGRHARGRCRCVDDDGAPLPELLEVLAVDRPPRPRARHRPPLARRDLRRRRRRGRSRRRHDRRHPPRVPLAADQPGRPARARRARRADGARVHHPVHRQVHVGRDASPRPARSAPAARSRAPTSGSASTRRSRTGSRIMADRFLEAGFTDDEVRIMAVDNTRRVAGVGVSRRVQVSAPTRPTSCGAQAARSPRPSRRRRGR